MVKLSELQTAEEIHEQDMQDPEYRREYERTRLATDIAIKVIEYRADHGLSQTALGRNLGMSQPNVARLEAGEHLPSVDTLARLASVLGLDFSIDVKPDRVALRYASRRGTRAHMPSIASEIRQSAASAQSGSRRAAARERERENV
ncbi:MAG: helix-turn-helix domain-containing protein [Streptosporangiaceae bacterium]